MKQESACAVPLPKNSEDSHSQQSECSEKRARRREFKQASERYVDDTPLARRPRGTMPGLSQR